MGTIRRIADAISILQRSKATSPFDSGGNGAFGILNGVLSNRLSPPLRQTEDLLVAYRRLPWLRSIVSRIGFSVAATPWSLLVEVRGRERAPREASLRQISRLGLTIRAGGRIRHSAYDVRRKLLERRRRSGEMVEVEDHPLLDLLESFNPVMTGLAGMKLTENYLDLVGEAFWLKERGALGTPVALWPLAPSWIRDTPTLARPFFEIQFGSWFEKIPAADMVWFCDNDPHRPYNRGVGTAMALSDELETDEYAAKHTKREFFNNAVPEMLVTAEGLGNEETARLERDWKQKNRGFFKSLQVYFLNRKVEVKQLGQSFRSLQLIELRKWERDMVIQVFGVPPEILGIVNESKRATIDAADYLYSRWVLVPRLELIRSVVQDRLVPEYDERLILDYESPVKEDEERQLRAIQIAPWAANVDEIRGVQGLEPLPDGRGEVHMMPSSMTPSRFPLPAAMDAEEAPEEPEVPEEPVEPEEPEQPEEPAEEEPEEPAAEAEERTYRRSGHVQRRRLRLVANREQLAQLEEALDHQLRTGS
ncbi:MAG: phage portal protein [Nitrospiraceae bacterium]